MFDYFVGNSLWHLVKQADILSKLILMILFIMSVICWTLFICKLILMRFRQQDINRIQDIVVAVRSVDDLVETGKRYAKTAGGVFIVQITQALYALLEMQPDQITRNWELMQYYIDQTVDRMVAHEESYLPILSTSAAVAPLLGLFGTVWGLVHAFLSISEKQSADITVVAPGIAEALLTTLAGLIVAIPAFIMYNYLLVRVRTIEQQIVSLSEQVALIVQQVLRG